MIIGLSGHIKSGKTTAATLIKKLNPSFTEKYFAYKLKLIASILTGDEISLFETQEGKAGMLKDWGITRRKMLQHLGTEALRNNFDRNIWIKSLFADYKPQFGGNGMTDYDLTEVYPNWIVSDVRFPNEADALKERGALLIRINRPFADIYPVEWNQYLNDTNDPVSEFGFLEYLKNVNFEMFEKIGHPSEIGLDEYDDFDLVIENTSTVENVENQLRAFLVKHKVCS
jgi:hypothetical protein